MKKLTPIILFTIYTSALFAQAPFPVTGKLPVDTPTFFNWPAIQDWPYPAITNNGRYAIYAIRHIPAGGNSMVIYSLTNQWELALPGVQQALFTDDSRRLIYLLPNDSLCLLTLPDSGSVYIPGVKSFSLFMQKGSEWLACQMKNTDKELMLRNLTTGQQSIYKNVDHYLLSENGQVLVLQTPPDSGKQVSIRWVDLPANQVREIWTGRNASNLVQDSTGTKLAFMVQDDDTTNKAIWLYKTGEEKAVELVNDRSATIVQGMELSAIDNFSKDGTQLFIQLKQKPLPKKVPAMVPVNIWSYTDAKLQSQQLHELSFGLPAYQAVLDLQSPFRILRLQQQYETINSKTDDMLLLTHRKGDASERYWNREAIGTTYLVKVKNGERLAIPVSRAAFSPGGKYVTGNGTDEIPGGDLYVYELSTGITKNITENIPIPLQDEESDILLTSKGRGLRLAGWLAGDAALLVYDRYDIWQIDPAGIKAPVNLTNGRPEKWQFKLAGGDLADREVIPTEKPLLLKGFNKASKKSGFYELTWHPTKGPALLFMGDYAFEKFPTFKSHGFFLKARDTDKYLVKREQSTQSQNIFSTADFRIFTPVSDISPEKTVNWLTAELLNFTTLDNIQSQAVLYKPEDFDPSKKYPLIIHYYEKKSDQLNKYQHPVVDNGGELDIAWFVSHGYLVLLPDIHYKIGKTGVSVINSVMGAVRYLSQRPYIDKEHIGIQGHSFGGYETNYLVTHSDLFAAAVSSCGVSDVTSDFGNVWPNEMARQEYWEMRDGRMGTTPWENTDMFVENSPVFSIGKVKAPILTMHNKDDKNVHFEQGLEFFTGLRRAGKRTWMLEYDKGGHGVWGEEYKDYLLRMTQFFDHYLKGAPAPRWMTRGIPAAMKGFDNGFELDNEIKTPGDGLLIK